MKTKDCILFYVKFPENGKTKTRLGKDIGNGHAVGLYKCFILDMLTMFATVPQQVCVCYAPESAEQFFRTWLGENYLYCPQQGGDLGERMKHSFQQAFQEGFEKIVIIGSDLPDLPSHVVVKAFEELQIVDTVIGPSVDGGYYLLGFRHDTFFSEVFDDITWSTPSVCDQTLRKIRRFGRTVSILSEWHDIDNSSDLQQLYHHHGQTAQKIPNTLSYLQKIQGGDL